MRRIDIRTHDGRYVEIFEDGRIEPAVEGVVVRLLGDRRLEYRDVLGPYGWCQVDFEADEQLARAKTYDERLAVLRERSCMSEQMARDHALFLSGLATATDADLDADTLRAK